MTTIKEKLLTRAKKKSISENEVYFIDIYAIDKEFYKTCLDFYYERPDLRTSRPHANVSFEENIKNTKRIKVMEVAVYYYAGQFRELITDTPICGVKEIIELNPATGKNCTNHIIFGNQEPFFFIFSDSRNLFEYGCSELENQILKAATREEIEQYYIEHNNKDYYKLQIEKEKAQAIVDYNEVLIDFASLDLGIDLSYDAQRKKIVWSKKKIKERK